MPGPGVGPRKLQGQIPLKCPPYLRAFLPSPAGWNPHIPVLPTTPLLLLALCPPCATYLGPSLIWPARQNSKEGTSAQARMPSTIVPRASCNLIRLLRTKTSNIIIWSKDGPTCHRAPTLPWAHPKARRRPMHQATSPRVQQAPDTHSSRAPGPQKSQVRPQVSRELQALLTSGPGGDGFPGVGLIIGGVIAIQIHPVVIWVDLGRGPVPLWSHLIRGTSRGLKKKINTPLASSSPQPLHLPLWRKAGAPPTASLQRKNQKA